MISNDLKPATIPINKPLVLAVKSTNLKWKTHGRKEVTAGKMWQTKGSFNQGHVFPVDIYVLKVNMVSFWCLSC